VSAFVVVVIRIAMQQSPAGARKRRRWKGYFDYRFLRGAGRKRLTQEVPLFVWGGQYGVVRRFLAERGLCQRAIAQTRLAARGTLTETSASRLPSGSGINSPLVS